MWITGWKVGRQLTLELGIAGLFFDVFLNEKTSEVFRDLGSLRSVEDVRPMEVEDV